MKDKYVILCISIILLFISANLFSADVELITNPGFENGTTGWAGRNCTLNQSSTYSHSGTYCGQGTGRTSNWMGIKQSLLGKITNGATYQVSGWMRISAASDYIKLSVEQADENGTNYPMIAEGTGTNTEWTELSGTFTVDIAGTVNTFDLYFEGPEPNVDIFVDDVSFFGPGVSSDATVNVNLGALFQTMEGFGAAGGWYESYLVNHPDASTLYDLLFNQLGLDIYRFRNTYEIDTAYLDRTEQLIKNAKAVRPELKIKVASWSPPARLKSNGNTREGTLAQSGGQYMYDEFAQWWEDSLDDFEARGIRPDFVSIQNEPDYTNSGWDTCEWAPNETSSLAGFVEAFRAVYEQVGNSYMFVPPDGANVQNAGSFVDVFSATDKSYIYAYAYHLYGGLSNIRQFATTYTDKPHFMTEYSHRENSGESTFDDAMNTVMTMDTTLVQAEVSAYIYWELFWANNAGGLITLDSSNYIIRPVYYVFKQFSAFVHEGWQRVGITSDSLNLNTEAYLSPNRDELSIIVINGSTTDMTLNITDLGGFDPTSGTIYRTSAQENCQSVGSFSLGSALDMPHRSITTIALTGTAGTPGPTIIPTDTPVPTETPSPTPSPTPVPTEVPVDCSAAPEWEADAVYDTAGTQVVYNGNLYENNWYSSGQNPEENSGEFEVWTLIGSCDFEPDPTPTPEDTPTPTPTPEDTPTPTPVDTPEPESIGDANGDGNINIVDALIVAQYYVGLDPPNFIVGNADTNCDGSVNIVDALLIAQYYVGLIDGFCLS